MKAPLPIVTEVTAEDWHFCSWGGFKNHNNHMVKSRVVKGQFAHCAGQLLPKMRERRGNKKAGGH